jgi:hypothetical protein
MIGVAMIIITAAADATDSRMRAMHEPPELILF